MVIGVELGIEKNRERYCGGATIDFDNYRKGGVFLERVEKICLAEVGLHRQGCSFKSRLA
ncbi:hypothetical protein PVK06_029793 [Gossypium arboreum]|uniref:Uncharacterized protein n=1 Tax=Gossypium arboreum TaxID=29729 RepID=A0ABR0NNU7_GOSAR|nr:hypothetical protein PVK06_029793 [Gossypium arboreum]